MVRLPSRYEDNALDAISIVAENGDAAAAAQFDAEVEAGLDPAADVWRDADVDQLNDGVVALGAVERVGADVRDFAEVRANGRPKAQRSR